MLAVLISISFISTYFLGIWSEARGLAKEDLDYLVKFRFQEGKKLNDRFRLVEVSIKQKTKQLILIDCGSKMCAGMEPEPKEEITIHYFKIEDGFSLHIPNLGELANE